MSRFVVTMVRTACFVRWTSAWIRSVCRLALRDGSPQSRRISPDVSGRLPVDVPGRYGDALSGTASRRTASPVRLTLAPELGRRVDGAWWPHSNRLARELPELVGVLHGRLGDVVDIAVNWSLSENLPDLNSRHWQNKHQHLMAVTGRNASANLLIIPSLTPGTLAGLLLRLASGMSLSAELQATPLFRTAAEIIDAARTYDGPTGALPVSPTAAKRVTPARSRRTSTS